MSNAEIDLAVHMHHPDLEHWKTLGRFIGYLKGNNTKAIIVRKSKFIKAVMFCDSNYATNKETINIVSSIVTLLGGTLLNCSSNTQRTITLVSTEVKYVYLT